MLDPFRPCFTTPSLATFVTLLAGMIAPATGYLDSDAWRAHVALQLLVDSGADVDGARVIRAQVPPRRVVGLSLDPPMILDGGRVGA